MMAERGDVTVVHEPLVLLTDHGEVSVPGPEGDAAVLRSPGELPAHLAALGERRPVLSEDTLEYRYRHLFDHPERIAGVRHTFVVRDPARAIASHHAVKPEVTCPGTGYEHQWDLFAPTRKTTGERPVVVSAERLPADPAAVVPAYCERVGLPCVPEALGRRPGERAEWQPNRRRHLDVMAGPAFRTPDREGP
jgi:hypothetical protein